ncbi:MAG: Gfo/Idh/MocA family oxidoreductase [Bacteroidota bacterium]
MTTRRQFLKKTGVGLGVLSSAHSFANIIVPQDRKLGVALVGLGYYSTDVLAPALQLTEACELRGIVTGSPWKIPKWQEKYGIKEANVYNYENMSDIANNPDIDAIYVVLPNSLHAQYAIVAAEAGKHVWCEKPMCPTVEECQQVIDACNRNKVQLTVGYRMQHEDNTRKIMQYATDRPFGKIQKIDAWAGYRHSSGDHWKCKKEMGGGVFYDMGVYPLQAARYSAGEEPISIKARHETERPDMFAEVDETTYFDLEFPSGAVAACMASFSKGGSELKVKCERGQYELNPFQSYSGVKGKASDGTVLAAVKYNQQARQMDDDARAIKRKESPLVPGEEGMRDIAIVEAGYRSAQQGGETIRL